MHDCIPFVRSGLYQLVIRVKGIPACAFHCVRAVTSISHCFRSFRRGHHGFSESSCVLPAHGPRWLFLLSCHCKAISAAANQKPFCKWRLCTRKSVKRTIKEVRAKRLASAWQHTVMCPSHFCRVRVTSPKSQSHWKFCRVVSESSHDLVESNHKNGRVTTSHWFTSSSHCRVIQNFKLFLYILGHRSASGPSVAIGSPVDLQWL